MTTPPGPQWAWSDAWLLAAVMSVGDRAALTDVVAAADAINHAILTADEVRGGVRRLLGAGLITVDDRRYALTDAGHDLARRRRGGLFTQVDHLFRLLAAVPVREVGWDLEPGELADAVRGWHERAQRLMRRRSRRDGPA